MGTESYQRTCRKIGISKDGIDFISCKESHYLSLNYHHAPSKTSHPKSLWAVPREEECHYFCRAELSNWSDSDGNYWSISEDGLIELGTRGERLAFFGVKAEQSPWHGWPVGGKLNLRNAHRPPYSLIELLREAGLSVHPADS